MMMGRYLLLEHLGLGGILNDMPCTALAQSYSIECIVYIPAF